MDQEKDCNYQQKPAVEMFVATAMKQDELLEYCSRAAEVLRAEKDPGNAYRVDGNRPRQPAHCARGPLKAFRKPHPLAMNEKRGSM